MDNFRVIYGNSCSTTWTFRPPPKTALKTASQSCFFSITFVFTVVYLKNTPVLALFCNCFILSFSRDQLRSLYNICTILVQYLYVYNCTSIVQLLYIYCTTTGVGMDRRRSNQSKGSAESEGKKSIYLIKIHGFL